MKKLGMMFIAFPVMRSSSEACVTIRYYHHPLDAQNDRLLLLKLRWGKNNGVFPLSQPPRQPVSPLRGTSWCVKRYAEATRHAFRDVNRESPKYRMK